MKSIIRLAKLLAPFLGWVTLSLLLSAATISANIGLMGTSAYLIARAALHPSIAVLQVAIVGVRFFGIIRGVFRYIERLVSHSVNFRLVSKLRSWFYRAMEPLAPAGFSSYQIGDLLSRSINDINFLESFFIRVISPPLTALFLACGLFLFIGRQFSSVLPIMISGYLAGGVILPFFQWMLQKKPSKKIVELRASLEAEILEGLTGLSEVIFNGRSEFWLKNIQTIQLHTNRSQQRMAWINGMGGGAFLSITNLTMLGGLVAFLPQIQTIELGGVLFCVLAMITLAVFEAITPMNLAAQNLVTAQAAETRLFVVASQLPSVSEPVAPADLPQCYDLEICSLNFAYPTQTTPVLQNISLRIPENHRVAVLGPSGSGKTSLIHLLARFWDYETGSIRLGGVEIKRLPADLVRSQIGILSQSPYIFTATIRQNLILADPTARDDQIDKALEQAGLLDWVNTLKDGMRTWVGESGVQLSGGERQRLAIARLLLQKPRILILDEPLSSLDIDNTAQVVQSLLLIKDCSQLWVSHRTLGLDQMDQIYVLKNGYIMENGSPEQLLRTHGWYARMRELEQRMLPDSGTK